MTNKKWSKMTTQLWRNPEVALLSLEARGLFAELVVWQLEHGFIPDDELYFERLYGRLCVDFHQAWQQVTGILARTDQGWVSPFVARMQEAENEKRQAAAKRQQKRRHTVSRPTGCDLPSPSPSPLLSPTPPINSSPLSPSPTSPEGEARKLASAPHPNCIQWWEKEWLRTRGTRYQIQTKDAVAVSKLLKMGTEDEVKARMTAMLDSQDAWLARSASPTVLLGQWNQLGVKSRQTSAQSVRRGQPPHEAGDDLRDEWYKWHSRVNGFVPEWPGAERASLEIEQLKGARR